MADEQILISTRCKQGKLIITEKSISIQLLHKKETIFRSALTSVKKTTVAPAIFGIGGGANLLFSTSGGEQLIAELVPTKKVEEILKLLS